ncbi:hypothetical protein SDC9_206419 [bioreactor metagenome]|uniref:Uncharacterized protein n=1 Tax=bioreactor metagenome TaxID=1076179 RepID=A0A645J5P3_9ZZZZ
MVHLIGGHDPPGAADLDHLFKTIEDIQVFHVQGGVGVSVAAVQGHVGVDGVDQLARIDPLGGKGGQHILGNVLFHGILSFALGGRFFHIKTAGVFQPRREKAC